MAQISEINVVKRQPLVSVGIATYNRPNFLRRALNSVVNQTYENLEIIISSDCTPCRETRLIMDEYAAKDRRVRCFHQNTNLGPPGNTRFVLEQATGEYFMWADDDDVRDLEWVEKLIRKFISSDVSIVIGKVLSVDDHGKIIREVGSLEFTGSRFERVAKYFLREERLGKANMVCGMFRLAFLRSIRHWSSYRHNRYGGGDYLFLLDCIQHGQVVEVPEVRIFKRVPSYSEEFLRQGPGSMLKFWRHLLYLCDSVTVVRQPSDKILILLLIPWRLLCAAVFQFENYCKRLIGGFKRLLT